VGGTHFRGGRVSECYYSSDQKNDRIIPEKKRKNFMPISPTFYKYHTVVS